MHRPRQLRILPQLTRDGTIQRQSCHKEIRCSEYPHSQTADSRAKQTRCSSPARRSAKVNAKSGDGDSPGSAFSFEEVVESFSEPALLAGLPPLASPLRTWPAVDRRRHITQGRRAGQHAPAVVHGQPVPQPLVTAAPRSPAAPTSTFRCPTGRHARPVRPAGRPVHGCRNEFPFRVLEVGPHHPLGRGGQDNIDNLQLLRTHCNRVKRDWPQEYLNQYQGGMCISRVLKTTERTLILQPQISSRPLLDRRRYLTIPVLGLLQLAPQPQTNEAFGE